MNRNDLTESLVDFSKNLLVTIFAIFAFTSGPLLGTNNECVKVIYVFSLLSAILSLNYGFQGALVKINYFLNSDTETAKDIILLPPGMLTRIRDHIKKQYWFSLISLVLLTLAIGAHFLADNHLSVVIKQ